VIVCLSTCPSPALYTGWRGFPTGGGAFIPRPSAGLWITVLAKGARDPYGGPSPDAPQGAYGDSMSELWRKKA
jgi:hypothetical protein